MERKNFLAAAAAAGAAIASAGIANASASYLTANPPGTTAGASPVPSLRPPHLPGGHQSKNELEAAYHRLQRIIERLQADQSQDDGHRARAIDYLQQASSELLAAILYDQAHPAATASPG